MNSFLRAGRVILILAIFLLSGYSGYSQAGEDCSTAALLSVSSSLATCSYTSLSSGTAQNGPNAICSDATGNVANDDRWVKFVAPAGGNKIVITTTAGTVNDWVMEVWSACGGTVLKCADDVNAAMPEISLCQNEYVAGQTYFVRVWTYSASATGTMNMCIYQAATCVIPPSNDECINSIRLTVNPPLACPGSSQTYTTVFATASGNNATCDAGTKNDVWFVFNTGNLADINLTISTLTAVGLKAQVMFECNGAEILGDCFSPANGSYLLTGLNPQADYIIRVWATTTSGTFKICLSDVCSNPTATISGTQIICPTQSANLSVSFTGVAPFTFSYSNGTTTTPITTSANPYLLTVSPTVVTTYTLVSMNDASCTGTVSGSATVSFTTPQPVSLNPFSSVCINAGLQTLTGGAPGGGVYSGVGVSAGKFNPVVGSQTITYTVTYAPGCTRNNSQIFTVDLLPTATMSGSQSICSGQSTDISVSFTGIAPFNFTYSNGTTNIPVITSNNPYIITVSPTSTTTYTPVNVSDVNCVGTVSGSAVITVSSVQSVSLSPFTPVCSNSALQTLTGGSPAGGVYSGTGVSAGKFNPAVGTQTITYTINGGTSCPSSASQVFTVNTPPSATISGTTTICSGQSASININFTGAAPYNFTYTNGTINTPSSTSLDPYTFNVTPTVNTTYTLVSMNNSTCTGTISGSAVVTVIVPTNATLTAFNPVCSNSGLQTLVGGTPAGGVYSGTGVSAGKFDPSVGTQTITYTVTYASGCTRSASQVFTVNAPPSATLSGTQTICSSQSANLSVNFTGSAPFNFTYSNGTVNTPVTTSSNPYTLVVSPTSTTTYTLVSMSNGSCNGTTAGSAIVTVIVPTNATLAAFSPVCINAGLQTLSGGTPAGGVYSGTGVSAGKFDPSVGTQTITYTVTYASGCTRSASQVFTVNPLPTVQLGSFASVCNTAAAFTLTGGTPAGGTYSGTAVVNNIFTPSVAGVGTITITYTVTVSGCSNSASKPLQVTACSVCSNPAIANAGTDKIACNGAGVALTGSISGSASSGTWSGGAGTFSPNNTTLTATYTATAAERTAGSVSLTLTTNDPDGAGPCTAATDVVIINLSNSPLAISAITGTSVVCRLQTSISYSVPSQSGVNFVWTVPTGATIASGQGTNTILVDYTNTAVSGNICLSVSNSCGTVQPPCFAIVVRTGAPAKPASLTGLTSVCRNQTGIYKSRAVASADYYLFTPPAGCTINGSSSPFSTPDTVVTVTFGNTFVGDSIYVQAGNCKGISAKRSLYIGQRTLVPTTPASLTGLTVLCNSGSVKYTASSSSSAISYTFRTSISGSLINGQTPPYTTTDTSVFITFPAFTTGNVFVKANNGCGSSTERSLAIRSTPPAASAITGSLAVCTNQTNVAYSIAALTGATSYTWTVPASVTILSGQGTTSISVKFSATAGTRTISVKGVNACGNGAAKSISVVSSGTPAAATSITGPITVCTSQTNVVYSIAALSGATSYTWTVPGAVTILSGQSTTSITVKFSATAGTRTISVIGINACGNGASKSLVITAAACPRIGDAPENTLYNVEAYPNPVHDQLRIEFSSLKSNQFNLMLTDIAGRTLRNIKMNAEEGFNHLDMDMSGLSEGLYLLNVQGPDGNHQIRIVVE
jgi:hypothetical protein